MKKYIIILLTALLIFSIAGCGLLNSTTIPANKANFEINGNVYGPETTLEQLVKDKVIEPEEYFDELVPADASCTLATPNNSYGMKLKIKNNTKSPTSYANSTIIEIAVSNEYGDKANNISVLGLTLNDTVDDFKTLLGDPSSEIEHEFYSTATPGIVYYWNNVLIEGTKQDFDVQVITLSGELYLIRLSFDRESL